jgi:hypothetical protein
MNRKGTCHTCSIQQLGRTATGTDVAKKILSVWGSKMVGETTAPLDEALRWYLRSLGDRDTHCGWLGCDGGVLALRGASFTPFPDRVSGSPQGEGRAR